MAVCTVAMCPYCSVMHSVTVFVPSVCLCVGGGGGGGGGGRGCSNEEQALFLVAYNYLQQGIMTSGALMHDNG